MSNNGIQELAHTVKEKKFTNAQRAAIAYNGKGLLLSAGAGSGKTATLTEKVCRMVCNEDSPVDLSRMIIVTFTKLAASELRERIGKAINEKLRENPKSRYLANQLVALESAQISTIDSFFYKIIKPYFSVLGLPPSFKIMEEANGELIKERIMEDLIDESFEKGDKSFFRLADSLSGSRDEKSLINAVIRIHKDMTAKGYTSEKLLEWAGEISGTYGDDFFTCPHGIMLQEQLLSIASHYYDTFSYIESELENYPFIKERYSETVNAAKQYAELLSDTAHKGYGEARTALQSYSLPSLKKLPPEEKNALSNYTSKTKDAFKKSVDDLKNGAFFADADMLTEIRNETSAVCIALSELIGEFSKRYEDEKKDRAAVDFSDLSRYAHRLFCNPDGTPTAAAVEFSENYDCIFIDEYQDTNRIQDDIFTALSCKMKQRFMVGDIKQSIYAFRGAEPLVFANYRNKFANIGAEGLDSVEKGLDLREMCIFMSENFRSDEYIIDYVNAVSEYIFKGTSTPFEEGDKLICKKMRSESDNVFPVEVCIIQKPGKKAPEDKKEYSYANCEAEYVAERISCLIESGKKANGEPIKPKDIAVLLDYTTHMKEYTDALARRGIPTKDTSAEDFFGQGEILLVLCILNTIDNPLRDIYLAGAMKSPVFGFTVNDLVKLSINKGSSPLWFRVADYGVNGEDEKLRFKCASFCDTVTMLRTKSKSMSASELLRTVYDSLSLFSVAKDETDGTPSKSVRRNLTRLYEYARNFESESFGGLFGFIGYIEELMKSENGSTDSKADENSVSVMTIHKSKGLEFPVCFLCECAGNILHKDDSLMLFSPEVGPAPTLRDKSGLVLCNTPLRKIVSDKNKISSVYEQTRVLYVAMTRAVERLIVTFKSDNPEADIEKAERMSKFTTDYERNTFKNFASMILPPTLLMMKDCPKKVCLTVADCYGTEETARNENAFENTTETFTDIKTVSERLHFEYPYSYLDRIPSKVTVSKLRPEFLDEEQISLSIDKSSVKSNAECKKYPVPRFISSDTKAKPTDIGNATHVFLQFCNFSDLRNKGFDYELKRLKEKRFMTEEVASLVNRCEIETFVSSALFDSVLNSPDVRREFRFNVALPASVFTSDKELAKKLESEKTDIIAQGVIDLVFTDGDGKLILVDYKTDRLNDFEMKNREAADKKLIDRHKNQLTYYAKACEKMFGRKVDSVMIFSLALGDTVTVL